MGVENTKDLNNIIFVSRDNGNQTGLQTAAQSQDKTYEYMRKDD